MKSIRMCPTTEKYECISPKKCLKTKPCWWLSYKDSHDIIAEAAKKAGKLRAN